jgi:hypothetical protein
MKTPLTTEQRQFVDEYISEYLSDKENIGQSEDQPIDEVNHLFTYITELNGLTIGFKTCQKMTDFSRLYWFVITE